MSALYHRTYHIRALLRERLWGQWLGAGWTLVGLSLVARDEFVQPANENSWRIIQMIPHLTLAWWLCGIAVILVGWIFEASFRTVRTLNHKLRASEKEFSKLLAQRATEPAKLTFNHSRMLVAKSEHNTLKYEWQVCIENNGGDTLNDCQIQILTTNGNIPITVTLPFAVRPGEKLHHGFISTYLNEERHRPAQIEHYYFDCKQWLLHDPIVLPVGVYEIEIKLLAANARPSAIMVMLSHDENGWTVENTNTL